MSRHATAVVELLPFWAAFRPYGRESMEGPRRSFWPKKPKAQRIASPCKLKSKGKKDAVWAVCSDPQKGTDSDDQVHIWSKVI